MAVALTLLLAVSALTSRGEAVQHDLILFESDLGPGVSPAAKMMTETIFFKEVGTSKFSLIIREQFAEILKLQGRVEDTPVEHMSEKMSRLGISWPESTQDITNTNLTLLKIIPSLNGLTYAQYESLYQEFGSTVGPKLWKFPHRAYNSKGAFPPKMFILSNSPLEVIDKVYLEIADIFGGPGECRVGTSYIQKL